MTRSLLFLYISLLFLPFLHAQKSRPFPTTVNSAYEEREPTAAPDGRTLYFWRRQCPDNTDGVYDPGDIWYTRKQGDSWQVAQRLPGPLNSRGHEFIWQVSPGNDTLWIMQTPPGVGDDGLSYSVKNSLGIWQSARPIKVQGLRFFGSVKDFFLGPDKVLFLTNTDTVRGYGGSDLYVAFPIGDNIWGRPMNMGKSLNTEGDEDAPFLAPDGRTLYFNSNGRNGYGNHDIYVSFRLDESYRRWSEPVNLGPSVNTDGYDFDFFTSPDGNTAYWASANGPYGSNDLFEMPINDCEVNIYPGEDTALCRGEGLKLEGGYVRGLDVKYQWLKDGAPIAGATDRSFSTQVSGQYQLVRWRYGCRDTSASTRVQFVSPPQAEIVAPSRVLCLEGALELEANAPEATRLQWEFNGRAVPYATQSTLFANSPGVYRLTAWRGGCSVQTDTLRVLRFDKPVIKAETDARGIIPILPQWLWTNKVPKENGEDRMEAMAASSRQEVAVLSSRVRSKQTTYTITTFRKQGLVKNSLDIGAQAGKGARYLAYGPGGDLIMADPDRLLTCYKPNGSIRWTKSQEVADLVGLAVDDLGYIYVAAHMTESLILDGQQVELPNRGGVFVAKYSPDGDLNWIQVFPIDNERYLFNDALHTDQQGNVYLAGGTDFIANFGRGNVIRSTPSKETYYLLSLDPEGNVRWTRKFSTKQTRNRYHTAYTDSYGTTFFVANGSCWRIDQDSRIAWAGGLTVPTGEVVRELKVRIARKDIYIMGVGYTDRYFLTKHNRLDNQTVIWENRTSASEAEYAIGMAEDGKDNLYLAGLSKSGDLPGTQFDRTSGSEGFVIKYGPPDGTQQQEPVDLCGRGTVRLFTFEGEGLRYQWFLDGKAISGANSASYLATEAGSYQVQAMTEDCDQLSAPRAVTDCGGGPRINPPVVAENTPPYSPKPVPPPTPNPDDPYSFEGIAENNLILLLDVSGSMNQPNKLPLLKEALLELVSHMRTEDRISVISYAGGVKVVLNGIPATAQSVIRSQIESLASSGKTRSKKALKKAYKLAKQNYVEGGNNRIILATDGTFSLQELYPMADKIAEQDLYLSVFSFGKQSRYKQGHLDELGRRGRGNHENITRENVEKALLQEVKAVQRR